MASKQTDYVNAQFEDAQARIEQLFKEISKQDTVGGRNPIACQYCYMTWSWFWSSNIRALYIWKSKKKIHMACMWVYWSNNNTSGASASVEVPVDSWGIPPRTFSSSGAGGASLEVSPRQDGVLINAKWGTLAQADPMPALVLTASWNA